MVCTIDSLRALAGKVRQPYFRYAARAFDSMVALIEGDLERCEKSAVAARALGVRVCSATADHVFAVQASGHWRLQGRLLEAERAARDMSVTYPTLGGWHADLATIQGAAGRTRQARVELARLMADDMAAIISDPFLLGALPALADLCGLVGDERQARTIYQAMLPYADRHGKVSLALGTTGPLVRHLGKLARMSGDFELAECHYQQALSMAERMPSPTFVALACLGYADLLVKKGPRHALGPRSSWSARSTSPRLAACRQWWRGARLYPSSSRSNSVRAPRPNRARLPLANRAQRARRNQGAGCPNGYPMVTR